MLVPLSAVESAALNDLGAFLGVPVPALRALIDFESGWNPGARNPYSGARGLIQFTNTTARGLGYASADDLVTQNPTRHQQLIGPVRQYLARYRPFRGTAQDLFMAVFYPKARSWLPGQPFPDSVRAQNPGINTPADYVRKVYTRAGLVYVAPATIVLIAGAALWFFVLRG